MVIKKIKTNTKNKLMVISSNIFYFGVGERVSSGL